MFATSVACRAATLLSRLGQATMARLAKRKLLIHAAHSMQLISMTFEAYVTDKST